MKQLLTTAIVLSRTDFGEADRIITVLTPEYGKLRLMARGVRKVKSKLAGGIELFSTSHITFIQGRGDIGTLVSTRLISHYGTIIKDIERVQLGYELIKMLNRATEDNPEADYFELLQAAFMALDDATINLQLIHLWFMAQLLKLAGHTPNLHTDAAGQKLNADARYNFDFDNMLFAGQSNGALRPAHIKSLRLLFGPQLPVRLATIDGLQPTLETIAPLVRAMLTSYIRV